MTQAHENSLIRILSATGVPVGTGFLVSNTSALTCAHVVAAALGQPVTAEIPDADIHLDFPLFAAGQVLTARVAFWNAEKDSAVLEIHGTLPLGAQPARLIQSADLWQHDFRAFGFPQGFPNGVWASGRILGREAAGWYQVEDTKETGYFVQPGFSGGAVWDETLGGVVGLVVAADTREAVRAAFLLPVAKALAGWPAAPEIPIQDTSGLRLYYPTKNPLPGTANSESGGRKRLFLSYKRGVQPDESLALFLHQALSQQHDVFIDQIMPVGTAWGERIQRELEACDFLIPLLSASAAQSEMVENEISTAHQLGRSRGAAGRPGILPVRVAYSAPFEYPLSAYLNPLNWAVWNSEMDTSRLVAELLTAIAGGELSLAERGAKQTLLQPPAAGELTRPTASADPGQLERPDGTLDVESHFYLERPADAVCQRELARGGATIVIKAPRQMGKSSLLVRAAAQARRLGRAVAFLDFQLLDEDMLTDPQRFFQGFCRWIADELDLADTVAETWQGGLGHAQSCTKYFRRQALKGLQTPVTLVMDEVDRMLACPFRSDFFGMLRSWHNSRATGPEWRKLDLLLVISTEPYLLIDDLKQSPFNVGEVLRLDDFSPAQVADLNERHGRPFNPPQVERLHQLLGGQPYLTRQALYRVALGETTSENLLAHADDENGPFGDHLRRHLSRFAERPELARAMLTVIRRQACDDDLLYNRLHGAGLATREGTCVVPRCELYAQYFRERLGL